MGRPINKKHIGDGAGKIQVTAVKFAAAGEITTESHIVSQRSNNKFIVTYGNKTETCTLVNKSIGTLGASEFIINVTDSDGVTKQVTKLYNIMLCVVSFIPMYVSLTDQMTITNNARSRNSNSSNQQQEHPT